MEPWRVRSGENISASARRGYGALGWSMVGALLSLSGAFRRWLRIREPHRLDGSFFPDLFREFRVERLASFFRSFRDTLLGLSPSRHENPQVVILTPGPFNETYFEHSYLARYLGFTLAQSGHLTVRNNHVFLKTLQRLKPVDVIVRRVDDGFCDPIELRSDSFLGVAV
jgi:uncharacterized circularly permuted ATP-grasp superfamily protein